jgi:transcription elongation factor GreA
MAEEKILLTQAGYDTLLQEMERLKAQREGRMDQLGDVQNHTGGDNMLEIAAYFETITMKEHFDERIGHLQFVLERAEIRADDPDQQRIDPGERVTVFDVLSREEIVFDLLSGEEVMVTYTREDGGRDVSVSSPVGQAMLGKRVGDIIEVEVPEGRARYAIRRIEPLPGSA